MKQRKIITWILVLTVCLSLFSAAAFADETEETSSDGLTLTAASGTDWSLDENGVLTISSDAGMSVWVNNRSNYASQVTSVVIASGVTAIAAHAFDNCTSLTAISIPDSVTTIGDYAFCWCSGLTEITLPDSVTSIGDYAFCLCSSLTAITIPDSVTSIGVHSFDACTGLTEITLPASVTTIGDYAFLKCSSLTTVTFGAGSKLTSIGKQVFDSCTNLITITFGDNSKLTSIGEKAFDSCTSLTTIAIPDSVISIGDEAFYYCTSLTEITLPASVRSIGNYAFLYCTSLSTVAVSCVTYSEIEIAENAFFGAATSGVTITHAWDEGTVQTPVTCTTDGEMLYTCTVDGCGETKTEAIPATGHTYDTDRPLWSWSEDYSSATVSFTCDDCGDVQTENATVTSEVSTAATETEAGVTAYTAVAVFNVNGVTYVNIQAVEDIPATGHSYGDPVFTWSEDYSAATASFTCATCDDVQTENATVTSKVKTAATETEAGVTLYTATVTFNGVEYTATKELANIPATGGTTTDTTTPTPSPTATATATPTPSPTATATVTPEPTDSAEPTATAAAAATASPVNTSPSTGDEASPLLWTLLAIVCAAGLGAATTLGRKGRRSR